MIGIGDNRSRLRERRRSDGGGAKQGCDRHRRDQGEKVGFHTDDSFLQTRPDVPSPSAHRGQIRRGAPRIRRQFCSCRRRNKLPKSPVAARYRRAVGTYASSRPRCRARLSSESKRGGRRLQFLARLPHQACVSGRCRSIVWLSTLQPKTQGIGGGTPSPMLRESRLYTGFRALRATPRFDAVLRTCAGEHLVGRKLGRKLQVFRRVTVGIEDIHLFIQIGMEAFFVRHERDAARVFG